MESISVQLRCLKCFEIYLFLRVFICILQPLSRDKLVQLLARYGVECHLRKAAGWYEYFLLFLGWNRTWGLLWALAFCPLYHSLPKHFSLQDLTRLGQKSIFVVQSHCSDLVKTCRGCMRLSLIFWKKKMDVWWVTVRSFLALTELPPILDLGRLATVPHVGLAMELQLHMWIRQYIDKFWYYTLMCIFYEGKYASYEEVKPTVSTMPHFVMNVSFVVHLHYGPFMNNSNLVVGLYLWTSGQASWRYCNPLECHVTHLQKSTAKPWRQRKVLLVVCSYSLCRDLSECFSNVQLAESQFHDVGDGQGIFARYTQHLV